MNNLIQDVRYGLRMLVKNPGFTAVAVLTLALGGGANTAIFSVVNAVLLRPLPYPEPERLVYLGWERKSGSGTPSTAAEFEFFRDHNSVFHAISGYRGSGDLQLETGKGSEWVRAIRVSGGFFRTLGVDPTLGRSFLPEEERPGGPRALVLSAALWQRVFGGDARIVGQPVVLNEQSYTIVGIMPQGFIFAQRADVFTPLQLGTSVTDRGYNTNVIGRLKSGTTLMQAQADMTIVHSQFPRVNPVESITRGVRLIPFHERLVGDIKPSLLLLFAAVGFLLLIACANVANLLLARGASREREISIRLALGAGRSRLLRQFFTESLLLVLAGAATGMLGAVWLLDVLSASIPRPVPSTDPIRLDGRVLVFILLVALGTSVIFSAISFLRFLKTDVHASLKGGGRDAWSDLTQSRFRSFLVMGEVSISVILLVGAGLLIKSLYHLYQDELGFDPQNVMTMRTPLPSTKYQTTARVWDFEQRVLERIEALPGVTSAAAISLLPTEGFNNLPVGQERQPENSIGGMEYRVISPWYFATMRIPLLRGRAFLETDNRASQPVVIINERLAHLWWPANSPLGERILVGRLGQVQFPDISEPPREIVGVVGDAKVWLGYPDKPTIYVPAAQMADGRLHGSTAWVVRTQARLDFATKLREAVAQVDSKQRVMNILPMTQVISNTVAQPRFNTLLFGIFAGLAMILSAIGLYGVISYFVAQRTHEIGVRMALGAEQRDVLKHVLQHGVRLTLAGVCLGLAGAWGLTRFLQNMLFQVTPTDPVTFATVPLLLSSVALLASYIPAHRAAKLDPMVALRDE